jgi:hypothetical protein
MRKHFGGPSAESEPPTGSDPTKGWNHGVRFFVGETRMVRGGVVNIVRGIAMDLTQLPILLVVGARFDLLFGFQRTDAGFTTLLYFLLMVPLMNLSWLIVEAAISVRQAKRCKTTLSFLMPGLALFFLLESLLFDIVMVFQANM